MILRLVIKTTQQGIKMSNKILTKCGKEMDKRGYNIHVRFCIICNDSLQKENVKTEAKPLGEEQAGNGISSPETHINSVPPELKAPAHQEDRKEKDPGISVSQGKEISNHDPDRIKEEEGGMIWGAVAAFCVLILSAVGMLWLWWHNRKKDEAT